jgi:dephospho-CoA kinase
MSVIGITGSFGTGKSTVAKIFASCGVKIIDADKIVHDIVACDSKVLRRIIKAFGKDILDSVSKKISRKKLANIVFQKKKSLNKLCKIIHPETIKRIKKQLKVFKNKKYFVAIDAPLLVEAGLLDIIDKLVVVKADRKNQFNRIKRKMNITEAQIQRRINAQMPLRKKIKLADYVIDNNKNISFTRVQVKDILRKLLR